MKKASLSEVKLQGPRNPQKNNFAKPQNKGLASLPAKKIAFQCKFPQKRKAATFTKLIS